MLFDSLMEYETGIYVVCSDRSLMETINRMLKRQGIVGVTDTSGRTHYILDARFNPGSAARQITDFIKNYAITPMPQDEILPDTPIMPEKLINIVISETLRSYGFDLSLVGTKAIMVLIVILLKRENLSSLCAKEMFSMAADVLGYTYAQIERDIRYSVKKSQYYQFGSKSSNVVRCLTEEVRGKLVMEKGIDP